MLADLAISSLLSLPADTRGLGARAAGKVAAHRAAAQILVDRAPTLAALQAGASLSQAERKHILSDLQELSSSDHRVAAHRAIDHVISSGNATGHARTRPPRVSSRSTRVTGTPRSRSPAAAARPATPAPTTTTPSCLRGGSRVPAGSGPTGTGLGCRTARGSRPGCQVTVVGGRGRCG